MHRLCSLYAWPCDVQLQQRFSTFLCCDPSGQASRCDDSRLKVIFIASVMNRYVNICYTRYLICTSCERVGQLPQKGSPPVENHCSRGYRIQPLPRKGSI